jgi:hypothetical protein
MIIIIITIIITNTIIIIIIIWDKFSLSRLKMGFDTVQLCRTQLVQQS